MSGDKEGKGQQADGPHLAGEESGGPERFFFLTLQAAEQSPS